MQEGLLWFDNTPGRELSEKIRQAAQRYQTRLRQKPTVCYVNINEFSSDQPAINGIAVKPAQYIRPHHFWLGVEREVRPAGG